MSTPPGVTPEPTMGHILDVPPTTGGTPAPYAYDTWSTATDLQWALVRLSKFQDLAGIPACRPLVPGETGAVVWNLGPGPDTDEDVFFVFSRHPSGKNMFAVPRKWVLFDEPSAEFACVRFATSLGDKSAIVLSTTLHICGPKAGAIFMDVFGPSSKAGKFLAMNVDAHDLAEVKAAVADACARNRARVTRK